MKQILYILAFIILLVLVGLGVILWNLNPILESFRPQIVKIVSDTIKHPVKIGSVEASLYPNVGIELVDLGLEGAPESASVQSIVLATGLMPLLSGNVAVDNFSLNGARLSLTKNEDGSMSIGPLNLNDLAGQGGQTQPSPTSPTSQTTDSTSSTSIAFEIKSAVVKDVKLSFTDKSVKPAQTISLEDLEVELANLSLEGKGDYKLSAKLFSADQSVNNINLSGSLEGLNPKTFLPAVQTEFKLKSLNLEKVLALAKAYGTEVAGLKIANSFAFDTQVSGDGEAFTLNAGVDATALQLSFGELFNKPAGKNLGLNLNSNISLGAFGVPKEVNLSQTKLLVGGSSVNFPVKFKFGESLAASMQSSNFQLSEVAQMVSLMKPYKLGGAMSSNLNINISPTNFTPTGLDGNINLKGVSADYKLLADGNPFQVRDTNLNLNFKGLNLSVKDSSTKVQEQELSFGAEVNNIFQPKLKASVKADRINFAPFLPPAGLDLPMLEKSYISDLNLKANFAQKDMSGGLVLLSGKGDFANIPLDSIEFYSSFEPTRVKVLPSTIKLLDGFIKLDTEMGLIKSKLLSTNLSAKGIQLGKLSQALVPGISVYPNAPLDSLAAKIKTSLDDPAGRAKGTTNLKLGKGAIEGVNLFGKTLSAVGVIPGLGAALESYIPEEYEGFMTADSTAFDSAIVDSSIADGQFNLKRADLIHPIYQLRAKGKTIIAGSKAGDMKLKAQFMLTKVIAEKMTLKEPKIKLLMDREKNIIIPVTITSSGGSMKILPDITELAKRAAEATAREAVKKGLDKIAPGAGSIAEGLKGLF